MALQQLKEQLEKEFNESFVHKGEDGDDLPENWAWTIRGNYPLEVKIFLLSSIELAYEEGRKSQFNKWVKGMEKSTGKKFSQPKGKKIEKLNEGASFTADPVIFSHENRSKINELIEANNT